MRSAILPILTLLISFISSPVFSTENDRYLVVMVETKGTDDSNKNTNSFYPSEEVKVIKYVGQNVLIRRVSDQPSFETKTEEENELAKMPAWIPTSSTIDHTNFTKINSWLGENELNPCIGSCDSGEIYKFSNDGSFIATYYYGNDLESPKPTKWAGHLYRSGNILWARPNGRKTMLGYDAIFYLRNDGTICTAVECFGSL